MPSAVAAAIADRSVGAIWVNGVLTTNFRRLQPLLIMVMDRQAQSPTARAQAALPPRGGTNAER